eukprot:TRINITY_DN945_c0_g1_i13.p1 TRINITY_DN945_c0_g1~~TRINITY_DN945_c0_g1_i13.p1  ORF type:complete len:829 (-),score=170.86 TRINITY_DN945_c0_g1_i13:361-2847(-)
MSEGGGVLPSVATWLNIAAISIFTLCGGIVSLYYGTNTTLSNPEFSSLAGLFSMFSGIVLILLVTIWSVAAILFRLNAVRFRDLILEEIDSEMNGDDNNNKNSPPHPKESPCQEQSNEKLPRKAAWAKKKTEEMEKLKRKILKLRFVIVFSLLFAFLCEICCTGIFWYTQNEADKMFIIQDNCFCSTSKVYRNNNHKLRENCPFQTNDGHLLYCRSLYNEEMMSFGNSVTFTLRCQKLSGEGEPDPLCQEYYTFWFWFKVSRILLPILAVIKIPMIAINFFIILFNWSNKTDQSESFGNATWLHLDTLVSSKKIDPVKFYENMCSGHQVLPPVGERLGPYGQEKEDEMFISIKTGSRKPQNSHANQTQNGSRRSSFPGQVEFCMAPTQLLTINKMVRYSPPDKENNTFSTPLVTKREQHYSPNFDLSNLTPNRRKSGRLAAPSTEENFTSRLRKCNSVGSADDTVLKFSTFLKPSDSRQFATLQTKDIREKSAIPEGSKTITIIKPHSNPDLSSRKADRRFNYFNTGPDDPILAPLQSSSNKKPQAEKEKPQPIKPKIDKKKPNLNASKIEKINAKKSSAKITDDKDAPKTASHQTASKFHDKLDRMLGNAVQQRLMPNNSELDGARKRGSPVPPVRRDDDSSRLSPASIHHPRPATNPIRPTINYDQVDEGGYAIPQFVDRGQQQQQHVAPRMNNMAARIFPTNVANYHDVRRQEGNTGGGGHLGRQDGNTGGGHLGRQDGNTGGGHLGRQDGNTGGGQQLGNDAVRRQEVPARYHRGQEIRNGPYFQGALNGNFIPQINIHQVGDETYAALSVESASEFTFSDDSQ